MYRRIVLGKLAGLRDGTLRVIEADRSSSFGEPSDDELHAELRVLTPAFYRLTTLGGANGAAEAYLRGYWDSPDLTRVLRVLARNLPTASRMSQLAWLQRPIAALNQWARRNSLAGSKRNIAAHYDLSNEFFALMLDPSMTYSSGVFPDTSASMEQASANKYDLICRKLDLRATDHVLEIGTGWGGFAEYAVRHFGCRVTTTTISAQQHSYAKQRFASSPCADRIQLLQKDYRQLIGAFDKLVSIEMIEAVGERYLDGFFAKCSSLLKPTGMMALQAITMPDQRYETYRRGEDFIQRYIFPGGFLPSLGKLAACVGGHTDLRLTHAEDYSSHYARTLAAWRERFAANAEAVRKLGFDERFLRMWNYYLCYCQAGFEERKVGVHQLVYRKPKA